MHQSNTQKCDAVVVGAGIAGLAAAKKLKSAGLDVIVVEASQHVGGRIRGVNEQSFSRCPMSVHSPWLRLHSPPSPSSSPSSTSTSTSPSPSSSSSPQRKVAELLGEGSYTFETGAEFIHGEGTVLYDLARKYGTTARQLFTWAQGDGGPSEHAMPDGGIGYYFLDGELLRYDNPDPDFVALHESLWSMASEEGGRGASRGRYAESIADFLRSRSTPPKMMRLANAGYANTAGWDLEDISLGHTIDLERHWDAHDGEHDFRTKMSSIVTALADGLSIRRRSPVSSVRVLEHGRGVEVEMRHRGVGKSDGRGPESVSRLHASKLVVAVPVTVLAEGDISFSPPLPEAKRAAAAAIKLSPGCKVLLKFSARFWPPDCHGVICADTFVPEFWMDTVRGVGRDAFSSDEKDAVGDIARAGQERERDKITTQAPAVPMCHYVTAFAMGPYASRLCALPMTEVVDRILETLTDVFCGTPSATALAGDPGILPREAYLGSMLVDWAKEPYIRGAYSCPTVSEPPGARTALARPVGDSLFFAGEACNQASMMTAHGALESGVRAAEELLASYKRPQSRL